MTSFKMADKQKYRDIIDINNSAPYLRPLYECILVVQSSAINGRH